MNTKQTIASGETDLLLSFLVPVYNEEENVTPLYEQLLPHVTLLNDYEIIFIDDGSSDTTLEKIKELQLKDCRVYYLSLSKNFGHQNALKAGLDFCSGDVVISLDGDLQHPPVLIPRMIECWQEGYDVVLTTRKDVIKGHFIKRKTSHYFYKLLTKISNIELKPGSADFRLLDKKVVEVLRRFDESDIFYRGFVAWSGFRQFELSYIPEKRFAGKSKYTLRKMFGLASSGLLGFTTLPLRMVSLMGFIFSCMSFLYAFYAIWIKFFSDDIVSGWASIMAGTYFLGGIQLICIGVCGEYIGKIFTQVKGRPHYIVADTTLPKK